MKTLRSQRCQLLLLLLGCSSFFLSTAAAAAGAAANTVSPSFSTTLAFRCKQEEGQLRPVGCSVGEQQLSLDIFDHGIGEVGLRLQHKGKRRAVVNEIYLVDEAGLLRPESLDLQAEGIMHFRASKKEHAFPALSPDDRQLLQSDVTLLRRKEVSRIGRFLRSNGMGNEGNALTMLLKTTNAALDAELVTEASHECLLRMAVVLTSFEADPGAKTTFLTDCLPSVRS